MFVTIGTVLGSSGLQGELRVNPESDHPDRLPSLPGMTVFLFKDGQRRPYRVVQATERQSIWRLHLQGIESREQANALVGGELQIPKDQVLPLPEGEYYVFELIGLQVETEDGGLLGEVKDVLQPGANDVYVVAAPDGRELLIPAIRDVVLSIDRQENRMLVRLLPGLLDEEETDAD
ncbi:MAG: ribosome maturation factor RimM [Bacillota bacterium]|jgi:16S rRNA processing protein RimM